tara:strand:- start:6395 stop:7027 length:633 start_codon:yes stop_codon:yes gene_type:complete
MPKEIEAIYNPSDVWKPVEEGEYPAHVTTLSTREVNTKAGPAIVVNMEYKIAEEVSECKQSLYEMDGYNYVMKNESKVPIIDIHGDHSESDCSHLKDRIFKDNGFFVFLNSSSANKNARYFGLLENLGIELKTDKVDGKDVKKLILIEEEDVIGTPVKVNVKRETYITAATKHLPPNEQEQRSTFKVAIVKTWQGGVKLSEDEMDSDVPF